MLKFIRFLVTPLLFAVPAHADWSLSLGYHNPPGSNLGVNFMYEWTNWAFEVGIGSVNVTSTDSTTNNNNNEQTSAGIGGDLNLKYLFGRDFIRPYLQAGFLVGTGATVGDNSGVSAGTGSGFAGLGLMFSGRSLYFYLGGNAFSSRSSEFFLGLGFDI